MKKIPINNITFAAFLIAVASLASRLLGLLRDRILAGQFGAGNTLDVYYAAFRIPDLLFNLLVLGVLSASFVPVFTSLIKKSNFSTIRSENAEAWTLVNNILNILIIALIFFSLIGLIFAPYIMRIIVPGFSGEKMLLTVALTRIMFLSPIFLGISSILSGVLQSYKKFFIYSLTSIFYNIGIIFGVIYLVPRFGIYGLAYGVVIGAFLHMIIQVPLVFKLGFRYKLTLDWKNKNVVKMGAMVLPRTMTLAMSQVNLIIITIFASRLPGGSLTVFNFANNLQAFPVGIFGVSFAIAAFPSMAEFADNHDKLIENFSKVFKKILFFIIPSTLLFVMFRYEIIDIVFNVGKFNANDSILTANALGIFAISLFSQATMPLLIRVFYAKQDSKTPFIVNCIAVIFNVIAMWYFSAIYGVVGLILGFSIANIVNFMLLWTVLRVKIGGLNEKDIMISIVKFIFASILCGIIMYLIKTTIWPLLNFKYFDTLLKVSVTSLLGLAVYFSVLKYAK